MYRKLKRTWSHNNAHHLPRFKEVFPEVSKLSSEELCDRFIDLKMDFYHQELVPVGRAVRLTLPFAVILMVLMFAFIPIKFMITGKWWYDIKKGERIYNWFTSLKLIPA